MWDTVNNLPINTIILESVNGLPVTGIESYVFENCRNLESIIIPKSVSVIGAYAFNYCSYLKNIYYQGSKEQWNSIEIGLFNNYLKDSTIHYNATDEEISIVTSTAQSTTVSYVLLLPLLSQQPF